ncbi:MAG TPA: hypothetical protein VHB97_25685, partial [Polyangia bacterium]|nr:hypothetical protein [Polyangia bacterium]
FIESRWRWRWREVPAGRIAADGASLGVYRAGGEVPRYLHEAPRLVRWTAFSCFLFGQMFIPGLVVGLFGLMMAGVGLLSIPGLITAAKIYRVGFALLRKETRVAVFRARDAATWALWLNGIVIAGSLLFVPRALDHHAVAGLVTFVDGYGALSILQALLMLRAVRVWEDAFFT